MKRMIDRVPVIPVALVEWLEEVFPDTVPMDGGPEILYQKRGEQRVIRKLKAELDRQTTR